MSSPSLPLNDLQVQATNKQVLAMALPIAVAMLIPQLNFFANTLFLGHLGETELASAGITGVYYLVFALVGNGLNNGLQGLIARRAGEDRPLEIGRMFAQSIWIALLFAATGILTTLLLAPAFLAATLSLPEVHGEATSFLRIRILGLPFLYLFQMGNALLVGTNNSRYLKHGFITSTVVNIVLDYGLIYGELGMPRMGFNGAAVASVIAEAVGFVTVFGILVFRRLDERFGLFRHMRFRLQLVALVLRVSSPLIVQFVLSVGSWLVFYILIEHLGERPLAISNAMRNLFGLFGIFVFSFASTTNAMVSNIIGQGLQHQVMGLIRKIATFSFGCSVVLCLLINLFPAGFLSLYGRDTSFVAEAIPVIRVLSLALLVMSISAVWLNGVTGTGNTRMNLIIELVALLFYCTYIHLVLRVFNLSLVWAWASEFLYWTVTLALAYGYLRSGGWRGKVI